MNWATCSGRWCRTRSSWLPSFTTVLLVFFLVLAVACRPAPSPDPTISQLAIKGATVFTKNCARCHGPEGQGLSAPAVIGPNASLRKYITAKGLLDYIEETMPLDQAGMLSRQEYLEIMSFLLSKNGFDTSPTLDADILQKYSLTE